MRRLLRSFWPVIVAAAFTALGFFAGQEHANRALLPDAMAHRSSAHIRQEMASFGFCPSWRGMEMAERNAGKSCTDKETAP